MRGALVAAAVALLVADITSAATTVQGRPACISESLFNEMATAVANQDIQHVEWLLDNGCLSLRGGDHAAVLERRETGLLRVRLLSGPNSLVVYTLPDSLTESEGDEAP